MEGCESFHLLTYLNLLSVLQQGGLWMGLACNTLEQVSPEHVGERRGIAPLVFSVGWASHSRQREIFFAS